MAGNRTDRWRFVVAALVVAGGAAGLQAARWMGVLQITKSALPIRRALVDFDREALSPYRVIQDVRLSPEIVEDLDTDEYVQLLVARREGSRRWERGFTVFVTYYTGMQDQLPHVPEECFYQNAFSKVGDDTIELDLPRVGAKISIRRLAFYPPEDFQTKVFSYYVLVVNGTPCTSRDQARWLMADRETSHLYYSKVELDFDGAVDADIPAMDRMAAEVMDRTIAELNRSHFPPREWARGGPPASGL